MTIAAPPTVTAMVGFSRRGGGMTSGERIAALLDHALDETVMPDRLLDRIVSKGIADGLEWHEIVSAVDEAERRTGLALHPAHARSRT